MTDEELVGLASSNPEFFVHIVARYEDKILRYIRRISSSSYETAEDLGQETFIKAYLKINQFDRRLRFSSWLYRIAHNHVISFWRKNKNKKNVVYWDREDQFEKILETEDVVEKMDSRLLQKKLAVVLSKLKPVHKQVLVLKYVEDKDYREISDIIRRPVGSVGILILRAKAELKSKIELKELIP